MDVGGVGCVYREFPGLLRGNDSGATENCHPVGRQLIELRLEWAISLQNGYLWSRAPCIGVFRCMVIKSNHCAHTGARHRGKHSPIPSVEETIFVTDHEVRYGPCIAALHSILTASLSAIHKKQDHSVLDVEDVVGAPTMLSSGDSSCHNRSYAYSLALIAVSCLFFGAISAVPMASSTRFVQKTVTPASILGSIDSVHTICFITTLRMPLLIHRPNLDRIIHPITQYTGGIIHPINFAHPGWSAHHPGR